MDEEILSTEIDNDTDNNDNSGGEDDLIAAIRSLKDQYDSEDDSDDGEEDDTDIEDDETDEEDLDDADEEDYTEDEVDETTPTKKVQSKEENARFAAQRREQELQQRVQAELQRMRQESPEFQLASQLSQMYNKPVEQIMEDLREAQLVEESRRTNLPIELLRERQADQNRISTLESQLQDIQFNQWHNNIKSEGERLREQYPMLDYQDLDQAVDYILTTVRNTDMPLEDAVFALHGRKIVDSLAQAKVQDNLAKQSGRAKKTPLAPSNGKPSKVVSLTADEKYAAKAFGMTEEEYIKYKG